MQSIFYHPMKNCEHHVEWIAYFMTSQKPIRGKHLSYLLLVVGCVWQHG